MTLPKTIPSAELCELVGYTDRRLRQLADEEFFPAPKRGKYELAKVVRGLLRFLSQQKAPALERLNEAKLEAQQRENRIAKKVEARDYMETAEVAGILEIGIKALDLIPGKMESELSLTPAQVKRLQQLLDEARAEWVNQIEATP
jgi:ubiquinone biosynthesis protein COQ9